MDVKLKCLKWKRSCFGDPRVKWWNLTKENTRKLAKRITKEGNWKQAEDANTI